MLMLFVGICIKASGYLCNSPATLWLLLFFSYITFK